MTHPVRVRFAPSPTGHLHIGGARTAIYNWAFARHFGGTLVLRIDDTDPERSTDENTQAIFRALRWLGLQWDEGPEADGAHGPYFQTQRQARYDAALDRLKAAGATYPCFCSAETLESKREISRASGGPAGYDRTCRDLAPEEATARISEGESCVWRLKVPLHRGDIEFEDAVRGTLTFPVDAMDDFVLARSDGTPTYNFASVIDDDDMEISHVIRGDDHLSNTPKQILLYEALGAEIPVFAHLSMIWGPDGKRLSKRHGATSVEAYRDMGYVPEALVNYLALLGWSLDATTTIIDQSTLAENFSLDRISRNPAVFDAEKLEWMNGVYLRNTPPDEFVERMVPWLEEAGLITPEEAARPERREWLLRLTPLVSERVKCLNEIVPMVRFLFEEPEMDPLASSKVLSVPGARAALEAASEALSRVEPFEHDAIEDALREVPERIGAKPKAVFQAVRVAVSGSTVSPPLFESLELLGRDTSIARLHIARKVAAE